MEREKREGEKERTTYPTRETTEVNLDSLLHYLQPLDSCKNIENSFTNIQNNIKLMKNTFNKF